MSIGSLRRLHRNLGTDSEISFSSDLSITKKVLSFPLIPGFSIAKSSVRLSRLFGRC